MLSGFLHGSWRLGVGGDCSYGAAELGASRSARVVGAFKMLAVPAIAIVSCSAIVGVADGLGVAVGDHDRGGVRSCRVLSPRVVSW